MSVGARATHDAQPREGEGPGHVHGPSDGLSLGRLAGTALDLSSDGVLAFDRDCRYRLWNRAMETILGMSQAEVTGRRAFDLFPYLIETGEDRLFHEALAGQIVKAKDRPYSLPGSGRSGCYDAEYSPVRDAQSGEVIGAIGILRDTTERKAAAQRIQETEMRFRNMADVAPVLLWMSETDALCTFFNQTWLNFTGRTLEQEWGVGWAEGVHFEDFQRCVDTYMAAFAERRVFEIEYRLRRADGQFRWILDRGTPRYLPNGTFAGYIGSCVDITERKNLETDLLRAVRTRDEFLSIASHELRTPLTALQLSSESLVRSLELRASEHLASGRLAESAAAARTQVGRLVALVEMLLDISIFAEGRLVLEREPTDLIGVVAGVLGDLAETASASRCGVTVTGPEILTGDWDKLRLQQVVTNLMANALKFGAGAPVEIIVESAQQTARLTVVDRGIGIAPEDQYRIFQRFERGVSPRNYGGLGLGLWITKQIVEAHQGTIAVSSAVGQGARFMIELPLAPAPATSRPGDEKETSS